MSNLRKKEIDDVAAFIFMKKMMEPITKTKAYKLGLVDNAGRTKRKPDNKTEEKAITTLDKIVFKIKRLLGTNLMPLYNYIYLQTVNNSVYNSIAVIGSPSQKYEVKRIKQLSRS